MIINYTPEEEQHFSEIKRKYDELKQHADKEEMKRLVLQCQQEIADYVEACQRERFKELEGKPAKILKHAENQINDLLKLQYKYVFDCMAPNDLPVLVKNGIVCTENGENYLHAQFAVDIIKEELKLHIEALKKDEKHLQKLYDSIVKSINNSAFVAGSITEEKAESKMNFLNSIPNGEVLHFLYKINANTKGGHTILHGSDRNRHERIETTYSESKNSLRYVRNNRNSTILIELNEAAQYLNSNKANKTFAKIFLFTLQKMTAQNFPNVVTIPLQDFVDIGMYNTTSNAKRAFLEFFEQQKHITLSGSVKKGRETIREEGGVLFYHYKFPKKGIVELSVNENFNMEFIAQYFTVFPVFAYSLNSNAFSLVRYIFFLARQHTREIKEKGHFSISLDAVREMLGLPAVADVKNRKYKQFIIEPIEKAIEEIEEALLNVPEAKDCAFTITPYGTDKTNIHEWLQGTLEIGLSGEFAESFIKIAKKAEADRERWERAKQNQLAKLAAKAEFDNNK